MRVEHTNNNIIDITFDPNTEGLCLLDFVIVEEGKEKFLAQVIEISDDKYDASLNIAKIQIFYKVNERNEIVPYNGFTPTRTCKITVCNQKEMEDFINEGKETIELSINPKTMLPLKLNADFFTNKPVILADKMDDFNLLSTNLAHVLSNYKNVVIFDYTGSLEIEDSARLRASIDFRLPLDYETIDAVWEDSMKDATIEVQATCEDIFNEVKDYLKTLRGKSIPFNLLLKIIIDEYKKEKNTALWFLKNKLVKYFNEQLFAQDVKDIELLSKIIEDNKITVIDFSKVDIAWHKIFCEIVLRNAQKDIYLFMRLNDSTSNEEIINRIYGKNKINVIPSVSYGYKKLPSIAENFNNYIFLSTLNPIRNYGVVNPAILSLDSNYALLYGENTKELIFEIQNTVNIDEVIKERKNIKTIPIENFIKQEEQPVEEIKEEETPEVQPTEEVKTEEEQIQEEIKKELTEEPKEPEPEVPNRIVVEKVDDFVNDIPKGFAEEDFDIEELQHQLNEETIKDEIFSTPSEETIEEAEQPVEETAAETQEEVVEETTEDEISEEDIAKENQEWEEAGEETQEEDSHLEEQFQSLFEEEETQEEPKEENDEVEFEYGDNLSENDLDFYESIQELNEEEAQEEQTDNQEEQQYIEENQEEQYVEEQDQEWEETEDAEQPQEEIIEEQQPVEEEVSEEENYVEESEEITTEEVTESPAEEQQPIVDENLVDENIQIDDIESPIIEEEQPAEEDSLEDLQQAFSQEEDEETVEEQQSKEQSEDSLEDLQQALSQEEDEEYYDEQLKAFLGDEEQPAEEPQNNDVNYDIIDIEDEPAQEEIPEVQPVQDEWSQPEQDILNVEEVSEVPKIIEQGPDGEQIPHHASLFKVGEVVTHQKYGIGKVLEVIEYSNRTLLQIEFADGKRMLDADIAHIGHLGQ